MDHLLRKPEAGVLCRTPVSTSFFLAYTTLLFTPRRVEFLDHDQTTLGDASCAQDVIFSAIVCLNVSKRSLGASVLTVIVAPRLK